MKEKHTLIVVLLLLGLVVYYSFFESHDSSKDRGKKIGPPLLALRPEEVKKIEINSLKGGELIGEWKEKRWSLLKGNEVGNWEATIDDFMVNLLMLVEIEKFRVENTQLKNFGLENPALRITLTDITDKTYQILIGDTNPVRTSVYVKFVESPNVIITGAILNYELQK
ncbi:MAG TPA: DUF4340 domain-containing protein, partial [Thermodesulfobacteriota bacterium]|nr:DUF4340 domain-containing protein [Thermodesulfobacteriota bacterium]